MGSSIDNKKKISGYKKTKIGAIPVDWEIVALEQIGVFHRGKGVPKTNIIDSGLPCLTYGELYKRHNNVIREFVSFIKPADAKLSTKIILGDILFAGSGETLKEIGKCAAFIDKFDAYAGGDIVIFRQNTQNPIFLGYLLNHEKIRSQKHKLGQGHSVVHIYPSGLCKVQIPLPPLPEQQKIAEILSTWDEAIRITQESILEIKKRNKGLAQQLLTGIKRHPVYAKQKERVKTKVGLLPRDWQVIILSNLLKRQKEPISPDPKELYQQIGIRSHTKGIFYKDLISGEMLGNKSVFWIVPNCFVVNIVFAWEHAIAKTTEQEIGMIASHRFPMYKPQAGQLDLDFLLSFFKSPRGKHLLGLASPGGAGRNKTLGQTDFMNLQIPIPEFEEQKAIVSVLKEADHEQKLLEQKLETLQLQKKGLMQKLLTGEIRVSTN